MDDAGNGREGVRERELLETVSTFVGKEVSRIQAQLDKVQDTVQTIDRAVAKLVQLGDDVRDRVDRVDDRVRMVEMVAEGAKEGVQRAEGKVDKVDDRVRVVSEDVSYIEAQIKNIVKTDKK